MVAGPAIRAGCSFNRSQPYFLALDLGTSSLAPSPDCSPSASMLSIPQSLKTGHKVSIPQFQVVPGCVSVYFLLFPTVYDF